MRQAGISAQTLSLREIREYWPEDAGGAPNFEPWKQMGEERSGSFPESIRLYLLNKLFQLPSALLLLGAGLFRLANYGQRKLISKS